MVDSGVAFAIAVYRELLPLDQPGGTRDCVRRSLAAGVLVWLIDGEETEPRRVDS